MQGVTFVVVDPKPVRTLDRHLPRGVFAHKSRVIRQPLRGGGVPLLLIRHPGNREQIERVGGELRARIRVPVLRPGPPRIVKRDNMINSHRFGRVGTVKGNLRSAIRVVKSSSGDDAAGRRGLPRPKGDSRKITAQHLVTHRASVPIGIRPAIPQTELGAGIAAPGIGAPPPGSSLRAESAWEAVSLPLLALPVPPDCGTESESARHSWISATARTTSSAAITLHIRRCGEGEAAPETRPWFPEAPERPIEKRIHNLSGHRPVAGLRLQGSIVRDLGTVTTMKEL